MRKSASVADKPFSSLQVTSDECSGSFEKMLRRFVRRTKEDGILGEFRSRQGFVKPSQERRKRKKIAPR